MAALVIAVSGKIPRRGRVAYTSSAFRGAPSFPSWLTSLVSPARSSSAVSVYAHVTSCHAVLYLQNAAPKGAGWTGQAAHFVQLSYVPF